MYRFVREFCEYVRKRLINMLPVFTVFVSNGYLRAKCLAHVCQTRFARIIVGGAVKGDAVGSTGQPRADRHRPTPSRPDFTGSRIFRRRSSSFADARTVVGDYRAKLRDTLYYTIHRTRIAVYEYRRYSREMLLQQYVHIGRARAGPVNITVQIRCSSERDEVVF